MEFFQDLYLGESIIGKYEKIMKKLNSSKLVFDLYLIIISDHPDNMLEIIPQKDLLQTSFPDMKLRVIGLAKGKKEATDLIQRLIEQCIEETKSADVRAYLNKKWEEQI